MIEIKQKLTRCEQAIAMATMTLALACRSGSKLDAEQLDRHQLPLHQLAFAAAQLAGAQAFVRYAEVANDTFVTELCRFHVNEAGYEILHGCAEILREFDDAHKTVEVIDAPHSSTVIALGTQLLLRQGDLGPDLIDEDKRLMRSTFRQFANDIVMPQAEEIHRKDLTIPQSIIDALARLGCFGLCVPESYGGVKPDDRDDSLGMLIATEELSRASLGAAGSLITRPEILARALLEGGTSEQKRYWLSRLASGESFCAISVTEPDVGSDVASVSLRATRVEGGWLLNGSKTWCTLAGMASVVMVIARTDAQVRPAYRGLSLFLVEKTPTREHAFEQHDGRGGKMIGRAIPTLGYRGMHSYEMSYDNFFVPHTNLIGESAGEGKGFYYTMRGFMGGRLQTAARAVGVMQAAFDAAVSYAEQRRVFGKPIAQYPLTQQKLVRMASKLQSARQLSYQVAQWVDEGGGQMEASLVKLIACRSAEWVTREAMQIHGGMGYAEETSVSRYFVDARVLSIFEGAEETLALKVIGRELLERALRGDNR